MGKEEEKKKMSDRQSRLSRILKKYAIKPTSSSAGKLLYIHTRERERKTERWRWMTGRVGVFNWIIDGIKGKQQQQQQQSKHNGIVGRVYNLRAHIANPEK